MRSATLRWICGRFVSVGTRGATGFKGVAGREAMQSPEAAPAHALRSAAAGLRSRIETAFSVACTFWSCTCCIADTRRAAAAVNAPPAAVLPGIVRDVDAVVVERLPWLPPDCVL